MASNGQNDHESRLNRLEAFAELSIRDNEEFRERLRRMQDAHEEFENEHKRLLVAQVVMQDSLSRLSVKVEEIGDKLNGLIAWSEQMQRENETRFRRLEEKQ